MRWKEGGSGTLTVMRRDTQHTVCLWVLTTLLSRAHAQSLFTGAICTRFPYTL